MWLAIGGHRNYNCTYNTRVRTDELKSLVSNLVGILWNFLDKITEAMIQWWWINIVNKLNKFHSFYNALLDTVVKKCENLKV